MSLRAFLFPVATGCLLLVGCAGSVDRIRVGTVAAVQGNVYMAREGASRPARISPGEALYVSDVVESEPRSRLKLDLDGPTHLTIGPNSRLVLLANRPGEGVTVVLERGTVRGSIDRSSLMAGFFLQPVHVLAAGATASGQDDFTVWLDEPLQNRPPVSETAQQVWVINTGREQAVQFGDPNAPIAVLPGFFSAALSNHAPIPPVSVEQARAFTAAVVQATSLLAAPASTLTTAASAVGAAQGSATPATPAKVCRPSRKQGPKHGQDQGPNRRRVRCL